MLPAPAIATAPLGRVRKFYTICAQPEFKGKITLPKEVLTVMSPFKTAACVSKLK
jgi:hypothetical protein